MPAGLQIWDQNGNLIVDFTSRLARVVGVRNIDGNAGSFFDANLTSGDPFLAFQQQTLWGFVNGDVTRPIFNVSAGTVSWSYTTGFSGNNQRIKGTLFYGVK